MPYRRITLQRPVPQKPSTPWKVTVWDEGSHTRDIFATMFQVDKTWADEVRFFATRDLVRSILSRDADPGWYAIPFHIRITEATGPFETPEEAIVAVDDWYDRIQAVADWYKGPTGDDNV